MAGTPSGDTGSQVSQPYATAVGGPSAQGAADPGEPPQTLAERLAWEQAPKAETYIVDGDALAAQSDGG